MVNSYLRTLSGGKWKKVAKLREGESETTPYLTLRSFPTEWFRGSEGQRTENNSKIVSNRGLGQRALESGRAPRNRRGLVGWLFF
ncbi:hypothetical protein DVH24_014773 [Malus domestica]|uniref:Uncharacterized protein n=1 Tax=Malus domestica TaxID=3750 RepID=A0A498K588_MALDO|nr:hypothetical protein DVH24_014773 [Malus domestica]